jgi:hypothetical protein
VTGYQKLMELGRQVLAAERVFGAGSWQHKRAASAWEKQQRKLGVA